jgi:hypothetical protein
MTDFERYEVNSSAGADVIALVILLSVVVALVCVGMAVFAARGGPR